MTSVATELSQKGMIEVTGAAFQYAAAFCGVHVVDPLDMLGETTDLMTVASRDSRAQLVRNKLMDAAERLYAERGFAGASLREISDAAGQRNKSVVQYHFSSRDELIKAAIARHTSSVNRLRLGMVAELAGRSEVSLRERVSCFVLPTVQHMIDLGAPSWYARFMVQALVEPSLRDYIRDSSRLRDPVVDRAPELATMIEWMVVHACAEQEHRFAHDRASSGETEDPWRRIGTRLVSVACGMVAPP